MARGLVAVTLGLAGLLVGAALGGPEREAEPEPEPEPTPEWVEPEAPPPPEPPPAPTPPSVITVDAPPPPSEAPVDAAQPEPSPPPQVDAVALWSLVRAVTNAVEMDTPMARLMAAIESSLERGVPDQVWRDIWTRLIELESLDQPADDMINDARTLAMALYRATDDPSRIRELQAYEFRRKIERRGGYVFAETLITEAERAWINDRDIRTARLKLVSARTATRRCPEGTTAYLYAAIRRVELLLPRR